ncbi:hypothetical protein [Sphingomonas quercus]|uniref:Uncharacterized protein n=1 Tax=Sphingomonas quercus TaxID=2842451 RepID=A0ABS6BET7_9SPHN|nr:hypothetical protein [Sphingomonas quercus]MBU3076830.1 hypothetical protein [Sphingomonas quercus]
MKIIPMLAAALGLATAVVPLGAAANAQSYGWNDGRHYDRGDDRGWNRHDRRRDDRRHHYRGNRYSYGYGRYDSRPRCWTEWRYDHRVRICR